MIPRTKVFVGSLPPGSKPEELRRLFENFGVVTECDIMNRCGFVHMQTQEMAESAIKALNNSMFNGTSITVERGRMKERGSGPGKGRPVGRGGGGGMRNNNDNMSGNGGSRPQFRDNRGRGRPGDRGDRSNDRGGPMRRDRGNDMRNGPYNRNNNRDFGRRGGGGNMGKPGGMRNGGPSRFDRDMNGPGPMDNRGGVMDRGMNMMDRGGMGNNMMDRRYGDDNFGFSNEDRRGFALPERQMYPNDLGSQGGGMFGNDRRVQMAGLDDRRVGQLARNLTGQQFDRRLSGNPMGGNGGGGGGMVNDLFTRRNGPPMGNMTGGNRGMNMGYDRNERNDNYNNSFPSLGDSGMGNRNGPPRRDMMPNRRF